MQTGGQVAFIFGRHSFTEYTWKDRTARPFGKGISDNEEV